VFLHPSAALILWLVAVISTQYLGYAGLALVALALVIAMPKSIRPWSAYVRRARWLLLTLWLILAWNVPGEAVADLSWAPTYEGVFEASLHAVRLIVMLGLLAALFGYLGRDGMVSGLWGMLRPVRRLGVDSERLVVRLALVLETSHQSEKGAWRKVLSGQPLSMDEGVMHVTLPNWHALDALVLLGAVGALLGAVLW
jgi:energy-coupling factor transporter transmembrane protein EcfT